MAIQFKDIVREYMENSSLHGAKFIVDKHNHILERYVYNRSIAYS